MGRVARGDQRARTLVLVTTLVDPVAYPAAEVAAAYLRRWQRCKSPAMVHRELLALLAADLVPWRPGRHQPRALKRRPKPYPYLNCPRHLYRDRRHGARFRHSAKIT